MGFSGLFVCACVFLFKACITRFLEHQGKLMNKSLWFNFPEIFMSLWIWLHIMVDVYVIDAFNFKVLHLTDSGSTFIFQSFNILHHLCANKMMSTDYIDIFESTSPHQADPFPEV